MFGKIKRLRFEFIFSVAFLGIAFSVIMYQSTFHNPDNDVYWLIENGRFIVQNGGVPKINPWINGPEMKIIIQQPLCSLINYLWYSLTGDIGSFWQLAAIMNIVMILSMLYMAKNWGYSITSSLMAIGIVELFMHVPYYMNSRPYQLTIAMSCLLIGNLECAKRKNSYKRALVSVALFTIWQANFQMASLIAIPLFVSCYSVAAFCSKILECIRNHSIKGIKILQVLKWISLYLVWAICSLINPYGIEGALYLVRSRKAIALCKGFIVELLSYNSWSLFSVIALIVVVAYVRIYSGKILQNLELTFIVCGGVLAAGMATRNTWMEFVAMVLVVAPVIQEMLTVINEHKRRINLQKENKEAEDKGVIGQKGKLCINLKDAEKERIKIYFLALPIVVLAVCLGLSYYSQSLVAKHIDPLVQAIKDIPDDADIFTTFNTGGIVEFSGKKVFMDARPEIYSPPITGGPDRLWDWYEIYFETDLSVYFENNSWDYYVLPSYDKISQYLIDHEMVEIIHYDQIKQVVVVKQIDNLITENNQ